MVASLGGGRGCQQQWSRAPHRAGSGPGPGAVPSHLTFPEALGARSVVPDLERRNLRLRPQRLKAPKPEMSEHKPGSSCLEVRPPRGMRSPVKAGTGSQTRVG